MPSVPGKGIALFEAVLESESLHLLEADYDIRTIQELADNKDAGTAMICTHVLNKGGHGVRSPWMGYEWFVQSA